MRKLPIVFLVVLTGCTEQLPGTTRVTGPIPDPIVETQLVDTQRPVTNQPGIGPELYKVITAVYHNIREFNARVLVAAISQTSI
ncbi:MAG: hypothetical protein GY826_20765 [Fuerstiella sp.]|nr:hypothetical protein [Fuerstiella sp.]